MQVNTLKKMHVIYLSDKSYTLAGIIKFYLVIKKKKNFSIKIICSIRESSKL